MGMLRVMGSSGDRQVVWDPEAVSAENPAALAAVAEAQRVFADVQARGGTAFGIGQSRTPTRLERFDATAQQILLVPHIVGG
jgi:hypothetical protein